MNNFRYDIKPFALDICTHLVDQYLRCIAPNKRADKNEQTDSVYTAMSSFTSIRMILTVAIDEPLLLNKLETLIFPVLWHNLKSDDLI